MLKLTVAKKVLNEFVGGDFAGLDLAMRVYGHRQKDDCRDSELTVPFGKPEERISPMRDFVAKVNPLGRTPITYSLQEALKDFGNRSGEIILITDGIESCDEDPCSLIRRWRESHVKIKVHVVGFGLEEKSKNALKCLSEAAGTDYHDAQSAKDLAEALKGIRVKATSQGFLDEGTYEFRANPRNADEVVVFESLSKGDRKEILFELARRVKVFVQFTASGSNNIFRDNAELWQNEAKKYFVHRINGAFVPPGTYDVRLPDELTPFEKRGVVIGNQSEQKIDVEIPVGYVTIIYQRSDGSRDKDDRVFLSQARKTQSIFKKSGEAIPLTAGSYKVNGWRQKGNYDAVTFEVAFGENKQIILRAK